MNTFREVENSSRALATLPQGLAPKESEARRFHASLLDMRILVDEFGDSYAKDSFIRGVEEILAIAKKDPVQAATYLLSAPTGDYAPNPLSEFERLYRASDDRSPEGT